MRTTEPLALLWGVAARLALVGRRLAQARLRCFARGSPDIGRVLGEESRCRVPACSVVVGRLLVDENRGDRVTDGEPLSTRGAHPGILRRHRRLGPNGTKVIVAALCSVDVHLRHHVKSCSSLRVAPCVDKTRPRTQAGRQAGRHNAPDAPTARLVRASRGVVLRCGSTEFEAFHMLSGELGDQLEVLVDVQHSQVR